MKASEKALVVQKFHAKGVSSPALTSQTGADLTSGSKTATDSAPTSKTVRDSDSGTLSPRVAQELLEGIHLSKDVKFFESKEANELMDMIDLDFLNHKLCLIKKARDDAVKARRAHSTEISSLWRSCRRLRTKPSMIRRRRRVLSSRTLTGDRAVGPKEGQRGI
ncbi:hypothetical protein NE237_016176 [Protea cynaroides]|uniref:Uncharacterized protein n=1 Tax=Protea cynaroides TaxID=273540 RepID=A0A9Q0QRM2_9MAGN|nr:hypothetical protein NE237_016176 [Protea cynaroides]